MTPRLRRELTLAVLVVVPTMLFVAYQANQWIRRDQFTDQSIAMAAFWVAVATFIYPVIRALAGDVIALPDGDEPTSTSVFIARPRLHVSLNRLVPFLIVGTFATACALGAADPRLRLAGAALAAGAVGSIVWASWRVTRLISRHSTIQRKIWQPLSRARGGHVYDSDYAPDLVRVYTRNDLELGPDRDLYDPDFDIFDPNEMHENLSLGEILNDDKTPNIIITGPAGVGKTSLLDYQDRRLRREWEQRRFPLFGRNKSGLVPVLVPANRFIGCDSIAAGMGDPEGVVFGRRPFPKSRWLFLIDAIDEISAPDDRREVEQLLLDELKQARHVGAPVRFVLTSRGISTELWKSLAARDITEFRLLRFTVPQLRSFLRSHLVSEKNRLEHRFVRRRAAQRIDKFLDRMSPGDSLLQLIRLPLLARVAATIYFDNPRYNHLPTHRVQIYHHAVSHWLSQFRKRLAEHTDEEPLALRLLHAAYPPSRDPEYSHMPILQFLVDLASKWLEDTRRPLEEITYELLKIPAAARVDRCPEAVAMLLESSGLICGSHLGRPAFIHKTFAEFLAARTVDSPIDLKELTERLRNSESRTQAVFIASFIPEGERHDLLKSLVKRGNDLIAAGWLIAEGLGADDWSGSEASLVRQAILGLAVVPEDGRNAAWWEVIEALSHNEPHIRWILHKMADDTGNSGLTRLRAARLIAVASPGDGCMLLKRIAAKYSEDGQVGVQAAIELAAHDRAAAVEILSSIAGNPQAPKETRIKAALWMRDHSILVDHLLGGIHAAVSADGANAIRQRHSCFQRRHYGTGYDPQQVDRVFDTILKAATDPLGSAALSGREVDPAQFSLIPKGYYEHEVDLALRFARELLAEHGLLRQGPATSEIPRIGSAN